MAKFLLWLIMLPFRLIGITANGLFALLKSILALPARVLRGPAYGRQLSSTRQ